MRKNQCFPLYFPKRRSSQACGARMLGRAFMTAQPPILNCCHEKTTEFSDNKKREKNAIKVTRSCSPIGGGKRNRTLE
jgi:hypothetical protein